MQDGLVLKNGVAAIRVSTTKQGTDGDSPDAQREQIERFAKDKGIRIKKYFVFLESASKEQQPMQEAVDYSIDPKNDIELFIIKSIDRFTRGGSLSYDILKDQLDKHKVNLVDIYGVIRSEKVNTLHHLGFEYKWSVFSPSKKSEILEAERSKDELRDIMSRMIGAEIRYTQMGYWMRKAPFGYISEKIDTQHGKRTILRPHPKESKFITKMFELRASGNYSDKEIAQILNDLGYATRMKYVHSRTDPTKVIKQSGGNLLNDRHLWRMLRNPIYAGVNMEKWTNLEPVQCVFKGIVSVELFNKANAGRRTIFKNKDGKLVIHDTTAPQYAVVKGVRNPDFPYKKFVMCPECNKPLLGSASRGKSGKYYPAYHCNKRGHNFRVSKQDLEDSVLSFISGIKIAPDKLDQIFQAVESAWERSNATYYADLQAFDSRIEELHQQASMTVEKIKVLSSSTAIKYMEEDLMKIEKQVEAVSAKKAELENRKPAEISKVIDRIKYFVEHLEELLLKQIDPIKKAQFFGTIFDQAPTYLDLKSRTQKTPLFTGVNPLFALANNSFTSFGEPTGFKLETDSVGTSAS